LDPAQAASPFPQIAEQVLLPHASSIVAAGDRLASLVDLAVIESAVARVPVDWFTVKPPDVYMEYLSARVAASPQFSEEAENARSN
ncbi:MAG: HipA family kinase, partial [Solirubrobacterales bacterium]